MWLYGEGSTKTEDSNLYSGKKTPFGMFGDVKTAMKNAFDISVIQGFFIGLESEATKLTKKISNGLIANRKVIGETMFDLYKDTLDYGGSWKDAVDYLSSYSAEIGKLPNIQKETIENAIIFSKATGIGSTEVGKFVANMGKVGIGQNEAINKLNKIYLTARKYGVDATKATKTVADNIEKASLYGFKNGVDGLTKMVARAQQVGLKMEDVMKTMEVAIEPDGAIKLASEMQMLGGAVGALGDPFQLLYMAQNDIGKLQEEIVNATKSTVSFNEETGEFKLPVSEMYRMKEMAKSLNIDYEQLAKGAINAAKQQEVLARSGGLTQYSEEDRNLIASLSEIKDGRVMIQIPGSKDMIDAAKVSSDDLKKLRQDELEKADPQEAMRQIAKNQLSAQETANIKLEELKMSIAMSIGSGGVTSIPTQLKDLSAVADKMGDVLFESQAAKDYVKAINDLVNSQTAQLKFYAVTDTQFKKDLNEVVINIKNVWAKTDLAANNLLEISDLLKDMQTGGTNIPNQEKDYFDLQSGKKTYSDGFGEMIQLDPNDQSLFAPNIDELFEFSNKAYEKLGSIQKNVGEFDYGSLTEMLSTKQVGVEKIDYGRITEMITNKINPVTKQPEQITNLQDILSRSVPKMNEIESVNINQTNTTTQKVEGNVGVDGNVNINVNVPNGLLSNALSGDREFQQTLKQEIMNVVNDRLSKAYSQRQGNFSS